MILEELNSLIDALGIPVETGSFNTPAPDRYIVIVPLIDTFDVYADNQPNMTVEEVRLCVFSKSNYEKLCTDITKELLHNDFTITDRRYIGYDPDTGYHNYAIDVEKEYEWK